VELHFLGTGTSQGIPVIGCCCPVCKSDNSADRRLRCSVYITDHQTGVVIDVGPDFRQQMLRAGVRNLDGILVTHEHNDHVAGLDDIRPFNFKQKNRMKIYADTRVDSEIRRRYHYIFSEKHYPGRPAVELVNIFPYKSFRISSLEILPLEVSHGELTIFGFRIGPFAYITDAKSLPDRTVEAIRGIPVLVLNALHIREHHSHLNLDQAIRLAMSLKAGRTFLTHISHDMGLSSKVESELPESISLASDELVVSR
jgi:phosphoribosyl 1,2-cyclic phosphate phosphodiesterase